MSITYRIALEIPGEPREAPATFTNFEKGVAACVSLRPSASGRRGANVREGDQNKLVDHHYTVFEVTVPTLDRFMRAGIKKQYGEEPPV